MFRKYILITILAMVASCGFSSPETFQSHHVLDKYELKPHDDLDGDLVSNEKEKLAGRDPLIADIPKLRVRFLQNYKITGRVKRLKDGKEVEFKIDTKVARNDSNFKYRVGKVLLRDQTLKSAARVAKFSSHTWGEISDKDFEWVKYPEIDKKYYFSKVLEIKKYFNQSEYEMLGIDLELENSVKLLPSSHFTIIKNLKLNYKYYDYESEKFISVASPIIERTFNSGINETFKVKIENVPRNLIEENFLKRGEFILSEVDDYYIQELEKNYKTLISSIKSKTISVAVITPRETSKNFVALLPRKGQLNHILRTLYSNDFDIRNSKIDRLGQFSSNLPEYQYLSELRKHDKKGKWVVFTNKLTTNYLDYDFKPGEKLSLAFVTGKELSKQQNELFSSYEGDLSSSGAMKLYPLGNVTSNTQIDVQVRPNSLDGIIPVFGSGNMGSRNTNCSNNCVPREYYCEFQTTAFKKVDNVKYTFRRDLTAELGRISILINDEEFKVSNLVKKKKASAHWINGNFHLEIKDLSNIIELNHTDEHIAFLKLMPNSGVVFNGFKLTHASGKDQYLCLNRFLRIAHANNAPVSVQSLYFDQWQGGVNWGKLKKGHDRSYENNFSVGVVALVRNNFN